MLGAIEAFKNEVDSIISEMEKVEGKILKNPSLEERVRQLLVTWSRALKPTLISSGAQSGHIGQVDNLLGIAARNAGRRIHKKKFLEQLKKVRKILMSKIYIDIATSLSQIPPIEAGVGLRVFEEIPDLPDDFIPKALLGWKIKIKEFLKKHPFDQNVFIMVRYADESTGIREKIVNSIRTTEIDGKKFFPVVAKDHKITDDLYNPIACLLCCRYGVAIFDSASPMPEFNPNIAYELGVMHFLKRECLILKESSIKAMPSDILQKLYESFSSADNAGELVQNWLRAITT